MLYFDSPLSHGDIEAVKQFGSYVKITADLKNKRIVVGCELHADGEAILIEKGGNSDDIWGGGLDFAVNKITTAAVLNLRPQLNNDSMDILDPKLRQEFISIIETFFATLWQ